MGSRIVEPFVRVPPEGGRTQQAAFSFCVRVGGSRTLFFDSLPRAAALCPALPIPSTEEFQSFMSYDVVGCCFAVCDLFCLPRDMKSCPRCLFSKKEFLSQEQQSLSSLGNRFSAHRLPGGWRNRGGRAVEVDCIGCLILIEFWNVALLLDSQRLFLFR